MADNATINNSGASGDAVAAKEVTFSGDTTKVQMVELGYWSGTEGAFSYNAVFHAEDAAHTSGDYGIQALAVRNDTLAALAGADGDYAPIQVDASGAVYVSNSGITTIAGAIKAEDSAHSSGDSGVMALAVRNDTLAALGGADGDYAPLQVSDVGALYVTVADSSGAPVDPIKVDDAAGGTDAGAPILAVRDDEQGVLTPADGDYTTLRTDRFGNLKVTQLPDATSAIQYAAIAASSSGDNTLVAAAGAGVKIRVLSVMAVAAGDVLARFESGAGGTALTGQMDLTTNSGFTLPFNPAGWFETADNTLLNLELDGAVSVAGCLSYVEV